MSSAVNKIDEMNERKSDRCNLPTEEIPVEPQLKVEESIDVAAEPLFEAPEHLPVEELPLQKVIEPVPIPAKLIYRNWSIQELVELAKNARESGEYEKALDHLENA